MKFTSQVATFARNTMGRVGASVLARSVAKGYALPGSSGTLGGGGWVSMGGPHEPFAGAWQRNLDNVAGAGPNLFANSGVFTCTNIISSDISTFPVQILRPTQYAGIREPHIYHPAWALMQRPNAFQTMLQFVQMYITSKLTHGNTYVYLSRDIRNVVNEMFVLNPNSVQPLVADDGSIFYRIGRDVLAGRADGLTVPARDILHDRMMCLWHPLVGVSPLFAAGMTAMIGSRIEMASEQFFANMARSSGVLVAPGKIEKDVARRLQAEWEANYTGRGLGKTAVLSNGLDYKPMTINAADSELVAQLRWTIEDIARVYRVPAHMVGEMSKATYRNSEQMTRQYYNNCLAHHIRSFEQSFTYALGLTGGVVVEFDLSDLFRMEADVRFAAHQTALNAGFKSINEVRAIEDLPPVPGGEQPRIQMQYVSLSTADDLAQAQVDAANAPPPASAPAPDPAPAPSPAPAPAPASAKQLELDFSSAQMELLVDAFVERFDLGDTNGA